MGNAFLFLSLVLCSCVSTSATNVRRLFNTPSSSKSVCKIKEDFSTLETTLRTYILSADTERAARVLEKDDTSSLAAGLTYLEEQECAVRRTENRRLDPDIVAIQAIALSAQRNGEAKKLARVVVLSFESSCNCTLFSESERERMEEIFKKILTSPSDIQAILKFDGSDRPTNWTTVAHPDVLTDTSTLMQGIESRRTVCTFCEPPNTCRRCCFWCSNR